MSRKRGNAMEFEMKLSRPGKVMEFFFYVKSHGKSGNFEIKPYDKEFNLGTLK